MAATRFCIIASVACWLGHLAGCHSVPPVPETARGSVDRASIDREQLQGEHEGWLYDRVTGRDKAPPQPRDSVDRTTLGVQTASATEPVPVGSNETVITAATAAKASKPEPKKKSDDDDGGGLDLSALAPTNVVKSVKTWAGYGPDEKIARAAFDQGDQLFKERKFDEAAKQFGIAVDRWPDTTLEEDALFWRAESLFFADRYSAAHDAYDRLLKKYEYSRHLDLAVSRQFKIGRYWEQFDMAQPHWTITPNFSDKTRPMFDTWGHSQRAYEHVRLNDPTGPLADDALMASATAYYLCGRYEDAAINYDTLRKEYPKSEHQKNAHLLEIDSKWKTYQGPLYDGTPLKEVNEIADQTLIRFGPTLGAERDRVIETKNRVLQQQAERDWEVAQYYETNHYYGSARIYYKSLVDTYPQTQFAEMAQQRLEAIKGYPDRPADYLKWLDMLMGPVKKR
jgi:outer membrane protein assembly factor BamD (BamD/ComL family)